ncbi:MAG: hypothetical protein J7L14_02440 [Candidatus Diapherotrites archaeon]|nr:hypothetical protein [Candidatus Diapherotrites archaeon]
MPAKSESQIIKIIQDMVKAGEPEEKIISTLLNLGVEEKQAKRLLLLAEANTFALLESELSKMVNANIESLKKETLKEATNAAKQSVASMEKKINTKITAELNKAKKEISAENKKFQEKILKRNSEIAENVSLFAEKLNSLAAELGQVQQDLKEIKVRGVGLKSRILSALLIIFGLALFVVDIFFFLPKFVSTPSVDAAITFVMLAMLGILMFFTASLL